ncbi:MAG: non-ribosomal peptide synthetase, partial [bacterium]|nr:non-ribosomal peptide synthetase [bacterium]
KEKISMEQDFFRIGGHSLKTMTMASRIHKTFNVKLPLTDIFNTPTIRALSNIIQKLTKDRYASVEPAEKKDYYDLSPAQKRLYILQQMEPEITAYNMPYVIPLMETISLEKLEETFRKLIRRHESLRTTFQLIDGAPVQKVQNNVAFKIEKFTIERNENDPKEENQTMQSPQQFFRTFVLSCAPLLRVGIVETKGTDSVHHRFMLIDMHHIITDGASQEILTKEFFAIYAGESLLPLKLQYKDYAEWQNSSEQKQQKKQQEETWLNLFSGEIPVLNLPTDYPRPEIHSFEGHKISFVLSKEAILSLKETAKETNTTLYMVILSIFTILLSKLSAQEDIIVGTPVAGRRHADLENIIGMFVNTLPMRSYPNGNKTVEEYLKEVKENTLNAFEN